MIGCLREKQQYWYYLCGVSNQYSQGRDIRSSEIIRIDFETSIVETRNSIYELQNGFYSDAPEEDKQWWPISNQQK